MKMTYLWALYAREVKRFQKLWLDTIFSPIVSLALYLAIFGIVVGERTVLGTNYLAFVYTGLLAMQAVNASFNNPTFALVIAKNVGTILDLQVVPIPPWGVGLAYALAALTRALGTLLVTVLLTAWFVPGLTLHAPLVLLLGLVLTGLQFGMLGVVFGMWAKNFEALTFVTTFVMQPMIFLAGVFYPLSDLPAPWSTISMLNPLHHNINLLRWGVLGVSDVSPLISFAVVASLCLFLFGIMQVVVKKKLKV
jgi:ABC-2 type transport system permease protein